VEGAGPVDLMVILGRFKRLVRQTVSEGAIVCVGTGRVCR
jgi:hypothetical protein